MNRKKMTKEYIDFIDTICENLFEVFRIDDLDDAMILKENMILIMFDLYSSFYYRGEINAVESKSFYEYHKENLQQVIWIGLAYHHFVLLYNILMDYFSMMLEECEYLERYEAAANIYQIKNHFKDHFKMNDEEFMINDD